MMNYGFNLMVEGVPASDDGFVAFAEAVYEFAPDSTVSIDRVGFDRDANSLREAVVSAIESVRRAAPGVTVIGVVLDDGRTLASLLGADPVPAGQEAVAAVK